MKKLTCSLLSIIILLTISCEIGLGSSVDTDAPSLNIAPEIVDTVKAKDFDIEGTYSDDGSIQNIRAVLHRTDDMGSDIKIDNYELIEDPKKRGSGIWKIPVNSEEIIDGSYQATVYITDGVGRVTTQNTTFTIDNTPPVLILTKPVSKPGDETISAYGQRIFLEGSIADTSKETNITVDFYNNAECTGDPLVSIPVGPIAPTDVNSNNARIAVFNDNEDVKKLYEKIYQSSTKEGSKDVYIKITASDMAGNETSDFYFSKDLAKNITKTKKPGTEAYGLAPIDIYNILNGTDALKSSGRAAEDSDTANIKRLLNESKNQTAMISVNPENSPYFTVSGMKILTKSGKDFESKENGYFVINGAQSLEISVFMGSDSIELVDDDSDTAPEDREFYVYALECDEYGDPLKEDKEENRIKLYSKSKESGSGANKKTYYSIGGKQGHKTTSGAYVFTVPMNKTVIFNPDIYNAKDPSPQGIVTQNLEIGKNYIIRVSGKDNEGNPIEPSEALGYGFHLSSGGGAPVLEIEEPATATAYYSKGNGVRFVGTAKSDEGVPEITIWKSEKGKDDEQIAIVELNSQIDGEENSFDYTIPASMFDQINSATYSLKIIASQGDGVTILPYSIWYDVKAPDITINSQQPIVKDETGQKCINGKFTVTGMIIDDKTQVTSAVYKVIQNGEEISGFGDNIENSFSITIDTNLKNSAGTALIKDKENVSIVIEAKDTVGNIKTETLTYKVDQSTDKPVIDNSSTGLDITTGTDESVFAEGKNLFVRGGTLVLSVSDDDSVKNAIVKMGIKKNNGTFEEPPTTGDGTVYKNYIKPSLISHSLPTDIGIYLATIIVEDENYKSNAETPNNYTECQFVIRVTGTGPDVTIMPEKEYISTLNGTGNNIISFSIADDGNGPYLLQKNGDIQFNGEPKTAPFDYEVSYPQGTLETDDIKFRVIDKNQSFTDKIYSPKFDNTLPTVNISSYPNKNLTEDTSYLFKGDNTYDTPSGIKAVKIKFIDGNDAESTSAATSEWLDCIVGLRNWSYEAEWGSNELKTVFATEGEKTVVVKAIDAAGNSNTTNTSFVYDKMKPEVISITEQGKTSVPESIGARDITLSIKIKDTNPVKPQVLIKQNGETLEPSQALTISNPTGSGTDYTSTVTIPFATTIAQDGTYEIEVIAKDESGKQSSIKSVRIIRDTAKPLVSNVKVINEVTTNEVYYNSGKYYINNKNDTYKISGIAADNVGINSVNLEITKNGTTTKLTPAPENKGSLSQWSFEGINLKAWDGTGATAKIIVKDNAGNEASENINLDIIFDTTPPTAEHKIDDKAKDILFRIGDYSNDAGDPDVGGKYSNGTYGSALTIQIRGLFNDNSNGSGINKFYYAVFNNHEVIIDSTEANSDTPVFDDDAGKVYFKSIDTLRKYVINNKNDTFSPLAVTEEKNVEYNITAGETNRFSGTKIKTQDGYDQYRLSNVESNYKTTIKGFKEGKNFLVLVAEDNVGNSSVDYADVSGTIYPCYTLNVDITAPTIPQKHNTPVYTNFDEADTVAANKVEITGTVSDKPGAPNGSSGIKEIIFTSDAGLLDENGKSRTVILKDSDLEDIHTTEDATLKRWTVDVKKLLKASEGNAIISAKVVDNAGYETSLPVANITLDTTGPSIIITTPVQDDTTGPSITLKGTANDGNGAGIDTSKELTLYYTKKENVSIPTEETIGTNAASQWVLDKTIHTLNGQNWEVDFEASDSIAEPGNNTPIYFSVGAFDLAGTGNPGYSAPVKVMVDKEAPSITSIKVEDISVEDITENTWFKNKTLNVTGTATDTASGVTAIKYQIKHKNDQNYPEAASVALNDEFSMNLKDYNLEAGRYENNFEDETHIFRVWAIDKVGNESAAKEYSLNIDSTLPVIEFNNSGLIGSNGGNSIPVNIKVRDKNLKEVYATVRNGNNEQDSDSISPTENDDTTNLDVEINIKPCIDALGGGNHSVSVTATDKAGNSRTINIGNIFIDEEAPSISIMNSSSTNTTVTLSGNADDGNGVGIDKDSGLIIYYRNTSEVAPAKPTDETISNWTQVTTGTIVSDKQTPSSITWNKTFDITSITDSNKNNHLYFVVSLKDKSGTGNNGYSEPIEVVIDRLSPNLTFNVGSESGTNLGENTSIWFNNTTLNLSGTATDDSDGSGIKKIEYRVKKAGASDYANPVSVATDGEFDVNEKEFAAGTNKITVWAVDKAGNTSTETEYTIKIDKIAPEITSDSITAYSNGVDACNISVEAQDETNGSGITSVVLTDGTNVTDPLTINAGVYSADVHEWFSSLASEKTVSISAIVKDVAGNEKKDTVAIITVDKKGPELTITTPSIDDTFSSDSIILAGTITDGTGKGVKSNTFELYYTTSSSVAVNAPTTQTIGSTANSSWVLATTGTGSGVSGQNWTCTFDASSVASAEANTPIYFVVGAKDNFTTGNQGYSSIRNVIIDKKKPVQTELKISEAAYDSTKWFKTQTIGISGKFTDTNGSGVSKVWYQIKNDGSSNYNDAEYVLAVKGNEGYTFTANASGFQDGINKLKVWAEDAAGNTSSSSIEYTINIDTKALEISTLDYDKYSNRSVAIPIEFTITDGINSPGTTASGTDSVSVEINGKKKDATFSSNKWTASFPIDDLPTTSNSYPIRVTATDKAGNITESLKIGNLIIDTDKPTVTINKIANKDSPSQNDFTISANKTIVNGNITVSGTAGDTQALKTLTVAYKLASAPDTDDKWTKKIETVSNTWTFDLDTTTALTDGQDYVIRASVADEAGNSNTTEKTIHVSRDSDRPVIKFNNIDITKMYETGGLWIKNKDIYGSVTDDDGEVTSVQISYNYGIEDVTPTWDDCWTAENGLNFSTEGKDGPQNIYFWVKDVNNNDYITSLGSKNPSTSATYNAPDLNAPKIQYSNIIYGNTITDSTGSTLTRYSTVINAKIDLTEPTIPVAYYSTDNWGTYGDSSVASIIDNTTNPHKPKTIGGKTWTDLSGVTSSFGGDHEDIYIIVQASDVNGIKEIEAKFDESKSIAGATLSTVASNDTVKLYRLNITNVTGSPAGTLILSAKDNAELSGERKFNISVDKDAPKVTIDSPSANTSIYGTEGVADANVTVRGKADNDAAHIFMAVTKYEDAEKATSYKPSNFVEITKSNALSWNAIFNGKKGTASENDYYEDRFNDWVDTVYRSGTSSDTSITEKEICLWFYAVDNLGNSGYETGEIEKLPLKILTQGDRPTVTISTPSNGGKVGGTITIAGSTSIAINSVEEVYVQIDPKSDSSTTFDELNWNTHLNNIITGKTTEQLGYSLVTTGDNTIRQAVKASGSKSNWNLLINQASEFNITNGNRNIVVRVYAKSKNGKISDPVDCYFELDPNSPTFGQTESIVLSENADGTGTRIPYERGMYLKGNWYLFGSAEDDSGVNTITCSNTDLTVTVSEEKTKEKNSKTIKYKVFSIPLSGEGEKQFTLTATEQGGSNTGTQQILVNFDNTAPTYEANLTSTGNQIVQTDGVYEMSGTFSDGTSGSGFERIAFYVTRTDNGVEYLTDIMKPQGQNIADNSYTTTSLTKLDGLYWKTGLEAAISNGEVTVSYEDTMPDYIRRGSLCRINGSIYRIETIRRDETTAPKTVTFTVNKKIEDTTGNTKVDVYFALAQVIDHAVTEGGYTEDYDADYDFDDEKKNEDRISGDDNDQMVERWRETTGEWSVSINSKNIKDGDVTIYFVAFDKAGNKTEEHYSGNVSNNAPRFAGVKFGTDTNGNDRVEEDEMKTTYVGWYNTSDKAHKKDGITISGQEANGNKITKWAIPNNGKDIKTLSGNAVLSVKGNVKIVPEVVGGNNGLGWKYKVGEGTATTWKLLNETHSGDDSVRDTDETSFELDIEELLNATSEDGVKDFTFTITDMTGSTLGDETCSKAELLLRFNIALRDGTAPTAGITPFYWEGLTKNSVYSSKAANQIKSVADLEGHIELEKDLPSSFNYSSTTTSGEMDVDPKVSGIIYLEGFAKDNVVVEKLLLKFPGLYNNDFTEVAVRDRTATSGTYGQLIASTALSAGAQFISATEQIVTEEGVDYNLVNWKIAIDTSKISTVAATDVVIMVKAQDRGEAYVDSGVVKYGKTGTVKESAIVETFDYKKHQTGFKLKDNGEVELTSDTPVRPLYDPSNKTPYYKVDVVPYITKLYTSISDSAGEEFARSATGRYIVRGSNSSNETETVKLYGFNLSASTIGSNIPSVTKGTLSAGGTDSNGSYLNLTIGSETSSGDLSVTINGIESLNNKNRNPVFTSDEDDTITNFAYNSQANGETNDRLTDDLSLWIWDFDYYLEETDISSPMFKMDKYGNYYMSYGSGVTSLQANKNGATRQIDSGYNKFHNTNVIYDDNGKLYAVATDTDRIRMDTARFVFYTANTDNMPDYVANNDYAYYNATTSKRHLEMVYNKDTEIYDVNRVKKPKLASYTNGEDTYLALAYFDYNNNDNPVKFRFGKRQLKYPVYIDSEITFTYNSRIQTGRNTYKAGWTIDTTNNYNDYYVLIGDIFYKLTRTGNQNYGYCYTLSDYSGNSNFESKIYSPLTVSLEGGIMNSLASGGVTDTPNPTSSSGYHTIATNTTDIKSGEYVAVGIVPHSDGANGYVAVVAWYDAKARKLYYSYNTDPDTVSDTVWQNNAIEIDTQNYTGWYVDLAVDDTGGVHIAYYNSKGGDLKYAYLSDYKGTSKTVVTVDSNLSVGTNLSINVRNNGTNTAPVYVPYIYYYNSSSNQTTNSIKVAWREDMATLRDGARAEGTFKDKFTGAWESMTIPTENIPVEATVCGGVPSAATGTDAYKNNTVFLGYMTDTGYEKAYIKGSVK